MSFSIEENDKSNEITMSFLEVTAGKLAFVDFGPNAIKAKIWILITLLLMLMRVNHLIKIN